ncbi:uncharacterized protein ACR2FA_009511 [Aphomia sociella]
MNFRHILSKSSLKSSSSSGKSLPTSEDLVKLQSEVEHLKQNVESLKISVESRDAAIGTLAREKEKLYIELKSVQRSNRNLHQQLMDERLSSKTELVNKDNSCMDEGAIVYELKDEMKHKDEVICNIGTKYLKIKSNKIRVQKKFAKLQLQNQKICENIILLLEDNRKSFDNLLSRLLQFSTTSPDSKKCLKLLKINGDLHYENTQLKICLSPIYNKYKMENA